MFFLAQRSHLIENADEPVSLIANPSDFIGLELPSLNHLSTRKPALTAPKPEDVMVGPPSDRDHVSDAESAFPCPTAGTTNTTTATATTTSPHRVRFIQVLSATESQRSLFRNAIR